MQSQKCCCCNHSLSLWGKKNGFDLVKCPSCDFITTSPLPTLDEIKAVYSKEYFVKDCPGQGQPGYQDVFSQRFVEGNKRASRMRLEIIHDALRRKGTILDVGCSNGIFLEVALEKGWDCNGAEINQEMREVTARVCAGRTVFSSIDEAYGLYDVITMWEYLEHTRQPEDAVKHVQRLLRPQGLLCLSFPNIESRKSRQDKLNWEHVKPPEHLHYWIASNIRMFLGRFGFSIVGFRYFGLRWQLEAGRKFGSRSNPKTFLWPTTSILGRTLKALYYTSVRKRFSTTIRRQYEGIEVYARYIR